MESVGDLGEGGAKACAHVLTVFIVVVVIVVLIVLGVVVIADDSRVHGRDFHESCTCEDGVVWYGVDMIVSSLPASFFSAPPTDRLLSMMIR